MALVAALSQVPAKKIGHLQWYIGAINTSGEQVVLPGWLACNGAAVSRTTYAKLFAEIGTAYGVGDGSTTFNLPNLTDGRNPISKGATNFPTRGATGGERLHVLTVAESPNHAHTYFSEFAPQSGSGGNSEKFDPGDDFGADQVLASGSSGGSSTGHQNMPPSLVVGGNLIRFA